MKSLSNERLCALAQNGDKDACELLLEKNYGFIRQTALEQYRSMGLDENDIGIDVDDLVQEGSIGLLNAIPLFDAGRGMKFLTYAAPAIRNAMTDCIRAALAQFEQRMVNKKDGPGFQKVYLDDVLSDDERMLRIEAIAAPYTQTPEQIYIKKEQLTELYAALDKLTAREQTYLLYRYQHMVLVDRRFVIIGISGDTVLHLKEIVGIPIHVRFRRGSKPNHQGIKVFENRPIFFENTPMAFINDD